MGVFFNHSLPYFFEKRSLIVPGAMYLARLGLTGCMLQGSFCYWLPSAGITGTFCMPSLLMWMPGIQTQVLKLRWSVLYWLCHLRSPSQIIVKVKVLAETYFSIYLFHKLIGSGWHSCVIMSIALFKKSRSKNFQDDGKLFEITT